MGPVSSVKPRQNGMLSAPRRRRSSWSHSFCCCCFSDGSRLNSLAMGSPAWMLSRLENLSGRLQRLSVELSLYWSFAISQKDSVVVLVRVKCGQRPRILTFHGKVLLL